MPKVSEEHRTARRDEIVQAAMRRFAIKGFEATSMADIIAESGLSAGAIYGNFANKADLIGRTVTSMLGRRVEDFEREIAGAGVLSPADMVAIFLRGTPAEFDPRLLAQLWATAAVDDNLRGFADQIVARIRTTFRTYIQRWYDETRPGHEPSDVDSVAIACVGLCQGFIIQSAVVASFDGEGYIAAAANVLPH